MSEVKPIPDGFHTITPHIIVKNASEAIEFYKRAFGAEEIAKMTGPDGQGVMHGEIKIGNSILMLCDEFPNMNCLSPISIGNTSVTLHVYVEDVDATFDQAVKAGATVKMPVSDMFWGDRYGMLIDPYGHAWAIATHKQNLTHEQIMEGQKKAFANHECGGSH